MIESTNGLIFDAERHAYTYRGRPVPSVTTVMRPLYDAAYRHADRGRKQEILARGSAVHKCVEDYEKGRGYDEAYAGYLRAWAAFRRDFGLALAPEAIEVRLYSKTLGFCGTPDSVFSGVLIDVKSSETPCPITAVQLAAYAHLLREAGVRIHKRVGVALHDDGTYTARNYPDERNDMNTFLSLMNIYRFVEEKLGGGVR